MTRIAFLGAGRMASAMVNGLLESKVCTPAEIACASADDGTGEALSQATGIRWERDLEQLLAEADIVVCAFKPQQVGQLSEKHDALAEGKLVLSILAGTPIQVLQQKFSGARNIVRAMPNTPGQIGAGITAYAPREPLAPADDTAIRAILGSLGKVLQVEEAALDAVTAVSGSGPAYVFEFIAALREGGVQAGLDVDTASLLALQTVLGAARLVEQTGEEPETLRDRVTSPGGTTLAGLTVMEQRAFRDMMAATVKAARDRSIELASGG